MAPWCAGRRPTAPRASATPSSRIRPWLAGRPRPVQGRRRRPRRSRSRRRRRMPRRRQARASKRTDKETRPALTGKSRNTWMPGGRLARLFGKSVSRRAVASGPGARRDGAPYLNRIAPRKPSLRSAGSTPRVACSPNRSIVARNDPSEPSVASSAERRIPAFTR